MIKIAQERLVKLSYGQKGWLFIKKDILAIIASIIALATWWQEKVTLEKHRSKVLEFSRVENSINQMLFGHRILQLQSDLTLANKYRYGNDTGRYRVDYSTNIVNEVQQEIEIIFLLQIQNDIDDDSVSQIKQEKINKFNEAQIILNTGNFDSLYNYEQKRTEKFSAQVTKLNNSSQGAFNVILERAHQQSNRYLVMYLISLIFLTLDRIKKVKPDAKSFILKSNA